MRTDVHGYLHIAFDVEDNAFIVPATSATEIIEQFKALSASERAQVAKFVVENDDSWIPEGFKQAMADAEAGLSLKLAKRTLSFCSPTPGCRSGACQPQSL